MTRSRGLDTLITDGVFLAHEAQLQLADRFPEHDWAVDLGAGEFRFTGPETVTLPVQLLGSAAPGPRSWLWGWANPGQFPAQVVGAANATRAFGERYDVPELVSGEVPFWPGDEDDDRGAGYELSWALSIAARLATGSWFGYSGAVGGGTRVWMLLDGILFDQPSAPRVLRVLTEGLQSIEVSDHRRAVGSYASLRGVPWDGTTMTLPDGALTLRFDEAGRIAQLLGSTPRP